MSTEILLSLSSIVCGALAWFLPFVIFFRYLRGSTRLAPVLSFISAGACGLALWFQLITHQLRTDLGDWSYFMDTADALVKISGALVIITLMLNAIALFLCYQKERLNRNE